MAQRWSRNPNQGKHRSQREGVSSWFEMSGPGGFLRRSGLKSEMVRDNLKPRLPQKLVSFDFLTAPQFPKKGEGANDNMLLKWLLFEISILNL